MVAKAIVGICRRRAPDHGGRAVRAASPRGIRRPSRLRHPASSGLLLAFALAAVALPVEFDASRRARRSLEAAGITTADGGAAHVRELLDAAAWTYLASLVGTFARMLVGALRVFGRIQVSLKTPPLGERFWHRPCESPPVLILSDWTVRRCELPFARGVRA